MIEIRELEKELKVKREEMKELWAKGQFFSFDNPEAGQLLEASVLGKIECIDQILDLIEGDENETVQLSGSY